MASRKPSQEEDLLQQADESLGNDPIDISGDVGDTDKEQTPAVQDRTANDALARGLAGAAPALMGFLFGASPATAAMQIDEAKKFYKEGAPKKLVTIVGPDGSPVYEDARMAVGEKAYQKPLKPNTSGFKVEKIQDPKTGKETYARVDLINKTMEPLTYVEGGQVARPNTFKDTNTQTFTDERGNLRILQSNKYGDVKAGGALTEGKGARYGIREDDVKIGDDMAKEVRQKSAPLYDNKMNINGAISLLNTNPSQAIEQAAGIFKTSKIVAAEKISDQERGFLNQAPSIFQKYADQLDTAIDNQQRQYIVSQMRNILVKLNDVNDKALASMQDRYVTEYASNSRDKSEYDKKYKYLADQIVHAPTSTLTESNVEPVGQRPVGKRPALTKEQWDALPESQKRRLLRK